MSQGLPEPQQYLNSLPLSKNHGPMGYYVGYAGGPGSPHKEGRSCTYTAARVILLMMEILHDFRYQSPLNFGSIAKNNFNIYI